MLSGSCIGCALGDFCSTPTISKWSVRLSSFFAEEHIQSLCYRPRCQSKSTVQAMKLQHKGSISLTFLISKEVIYPTASLLKNLFEPLQEFLFNEVEIKVELEGNTGGPYQDSGKIRVTRRLCAVRFANVDNRSCRYSEQPGIWCEEDVQLIFWNTGKFLTLMSCCLHVIRTEAFKHCRYVDGVFGKIIWCCSNGGTRAMWYLTWSSKMIISCWTLGDAFCSPRHMHLKQRESWN